MNALARDRLVGVSLIFVILGGTLTLMLYPTVKDVFAPGSGGGAQFLVLIIFGPMIAGGVLALAGGLFGLVIAARAELDPEPIRPRPLDHVRRHIHLAQNGDASSQLSLGVMYELGHNGLKRDVGAALYWYSQAAVAGNQQAKAKEQALRAQYPHATATLPKNEFDALLEVDDPQGKGTR